MQWAWGFLIVSGIGLGIAPAPGDPRLAPAANGWGSSVSCRWPAACSPGGARPLPPAWPPRSAGPPPPAAASPCWWRSGRPASAMPAAPATCWPDSRRKAFPHPIASYRAPAEHDLLRRPGRRRRPRRRARRTGRGGRLRHGPPRRPAGGRRPLGGPGGGGTSRRTTACSDGDRPARVPGAGPLRTDRRPPATATGRRPSRPAPHSSRCPRCHDR